MILKIKLCLSFFAFSFEESKNYKIPLHTNEDTVSPGWILAVITINPFYSSWKGWSSVTVKISTLLPAAVLQSNDLLQIFLVKWSDSIFSYILDKLEYVKG